MTIIFHKNFAVFLGEVKKMAYREQEKRKHKRPDWNEFFMAHAELAARRSTCLRRQVGAVAVRDKVILATGYNGAPRGVRHCIESCQ